MCCDVRKAKVVPTLNLSALGFITLIALSTTSDSSNSAMASEHDPYYVGEVSVSVRVFHHIGQCRGQQGSCTEPWRKNLAKALKTIHISFSPPKIVIFSPQPVGLAYTLQRRKLFATVKRHFFFKTFLPVFWEVGYTWSYHVRLPLRKAVFCPCFSPMTKAR